MPEQIKPSTTPQSHAQTLREDATRLLTRSPHPYHRQYFELPYASDRFNAAATSTQSPLRSAQNTDDEAQDSARSWSDRYRGSGNSDSGTEADDEHFLKGLPAPRPRPHKGLRVADGVLSGSASPSLSPVVLEEYKTQGARFTGAPLQVNGVESSQAMDRLRVKRKTEVVRRVMETALLSFVGGILFLNPRIRVLLWMWRKGRISSTVMLDMLMRLELACQTFIISSLIAIYPLRLLRYLSSRRSRKRRTRLEIPPVFDPAPLLYPLAIPMLVSVVLSVDKPTHLLPSIILSISSLPKQLIPAIGELDGANTLQWFLSCIPFLVSRGLQSSNSFIRSRNDIHGWDQELLVLLFPLHQALCTTLGYLTATSLLSAELQLLSVALIDLLLLSTSSQTVILKSLLWGGGVGILVTCENVLRWGVTLARVPKWRFRRGGKHSSPRQTTRGLSLPKNTLGRLRKSVFSRDEDGSNDDEEPAVYHSSTNLRVNTKMSGTLGSKQNGSASAVERQALESSSAMFEPKDDQGVQRRHTLPALSTLPAKSSQRTPSGRRKRSASSSVQAYFSLTQKQATFRKWLYAGYVYLCVLVIILVGIREYVGRYALAGNEPIGWALGYLFGDLPSFRMEVVSANLQRWICLPDRNLEGIDSCHLGWVEHLRHSFLGTANTRLILFGYWSAVIVVGLAVVFRLSAIYEVDTRRKVFHFMMVAMLLPATFVDPTFAALALSLVLAVFLLLDLFRATQLPPLSKSLAYFLTPYVDGRDLKGPVVISHIFLLIGCAIPLWLSLGSLPRTGRGALAGWEVPTREVSMVSGVICVGLGDAAASLIGRRFGRRKWLWGGGKSIEGSIAFATAVGLALLLAKAWLRIGGWPANNHDDWVRTSWKAGVAAAVASLTEAVLTGGNDNVVVPIVLWLCVKGLNI